VVDLKWPTLDTMTNTSYAFTETDKSSKDFSLGDLSRLKGFVKLNVIIIIIIINSSHCHPAESELKLSYFKLSSFLQELFYKAINLLHVDRSSDSKKRGHHFVFYFCIIYNCDTILLGIVSFL